MRNGQSNGRVKVEETNFITRDAVLAAVYVDFLDNGHHRRAYPSCYLYSNAVSAFVKIQYNHLIHHLSLMDAEGQYLSLRVERCVYTGAPKVIYIQ